MKTIVIGFHKQTRNTALKREHLSKREAWDNKAQSGKVNRDKIKEKQAFKLY